MTPELTVLALAGLLQVAQYALFAIPANLELGTGYTSSARDRPPSRQLSIRTARLQRAMANHFEALVLFTLAVVVVTLSGQSSAITRGAAWTYLAARTLYIPAYAYGWAPLALGHLGPGLPRYPHHDPRNPDLTALTPTQPSAGAPGPTAPAPCGNRKDATHATDLHLRHRRLRRLEIRL